MDQLRQQAPLQHNKRHHNKEASSLLSQHSISTSEIAAMDIEFIFENESVSIYQQEPTETRDKDIDSVATENNDNISKDLFCTRVEFRIKLSPHDFNPEEKLSKIFRNFYSNFSILTLRYELLPGTNDVLPLHSLSLL